MFLHGILSFTASDKAYPIFVQFFLGTLLGGGFAFYYQFSRDRRTRQDAINETIRSLIHQVDELYRETKQIKRMLRSCLKASPDDSLIVDSKRFEDAMRELCRTQLSLEQIWHLIRIRTELFPAPVFEKIRAELKYAESYYREVVGEFEDRQVILNGTNYIIAGTCRHLRDYLAKHDLPEVLARSLDALKAAKTQDARAAAWRALYEDASEDDFAREKSGMRYKRIAQYALRSAVRDMRGALSNRRRSFFQRRLDVAYNADA